MKKIRYSLLMLVAILVVSFSACNKLDINTDPNNLSTATPKLVLPSAQATLGTVLGNQWNYYGSMWAQYWTGGYGVSTSNMEFYNMQPADANGSYAQAYFRTLEDLDYLIRSGETRYVGVAKIMSAYIFQMLTDLYGDIPFSEALKGEADKGGIVTPKFDKEEDIYAALIPMIDEGIEELSKPAANQELGNEDLYYGGDLTKWIQFANTLKLKVLVRSGQYAEAKSLMNSGVNFIGTGGDAKLSYFGSSKNVNPLFARFEARQGVGMYYVGAWSSVNYLSKTGDPRKDMIYTQGQAGDSAVVSGDLNVNTKAYPPGGLNDNVRFSRPNKSYTFGPNVPVFFLSSWESKFLQAEVIIREGGDASSLFEEGVQASFDYYDAGSASTYVAGLNFASADQEDQLDILGIQKWISMNGVQMIEGWLETLRFDRPGHNIFTKGIYTTPTLTILPVGVFPSSFVYPSTETNYNPNVPKGRKVTDKRFWDN
ncbi:MAG: SusD/RagB family nutrient-binding outer membrane lipoprotein [Chitinophagales bacterium]|nr:SusD/RagB family nutrient-binding outer membrane lipoprotein [Chitinophagales bacterium]